MAPENQQVGPAPRHPRGFLAQGLRVFCGGSVSRDLFQGQTPGPHFGPDGLGSEGANQGPETLIQFSGES